MKNFRIAVLPFAFTQKKNSNTTSLNEQEYRELFFSSSFVESISSYWMKQSHNQIFIFGEVFNMHISTGEIIEITNRSKAIDFAIKSMESEGISFSTYDAVVLATIVNDDIPSDAGSTTANTKDGKKPGVIIRNKQTFDFIAHEVGHALGLNHSFGSNSYKNAEWSAFGEYGHPYCIMSARGYGGIGSSFSPPNPKGGFSEYTGLGPSLNAATAVGRQWIAALQFKLPEVGKVFTIFERAASLGDRKNFVIEVINPDGANYAIEYRTPKGWDRGQGAGLVIISQGRMSTADQHNPGTFSATFMGSITLPIQFGLGEGMFIGPNFNVRVVGQKRDAINGDSVDVFVESGQGQKSTFDISKKTLTTDKILSRGETIWQGMVCLSGTWPYEEIEHTTRHELTFQWLIQNIVTFDGSCLWKINDISLPSIGKGEVKVRAVEWVADRLLNQKPKLGDVIVVYEVQSNGTLIITNNPSEGTFKLNVSLEIITKVGSGKKSLELEFQGLEYRYPAEMYNSRKRCFDSVINIGKHKLGKQHVLPGDLWQSLTPDIRDRVQQILRVLDVTDLITQKNQYNNLMKELIGITNLKQKEIVVIKRLEV